MISKKNRLKSLDESPEEQSEFPKEGNWSWLLRCIRSKCASTRRVQEAAKNSDIECGAALFLGELNVGKTSIIDRCAGLAFNPTTLLTCKTTFRKVSVPKLIAEEEKREEEEESVATLRMIDTNRFSRGGSGDATFWIDRVAVVLVVFDVSDAWSFERVKEILNFLKIDLGSYSFETVLVANKCEPGLERQVTRGEGEAMATKYQILYREVSAKTNFGIDDLKTLAGNLAQRN